jgi:two-component system sensor histidine kinase KdpD
MTASKYGDVLRVIIEDDGPGLPGVEPARMFDKFQRGNGEGAVVGVGLGLTICRAIIQAHGGEIEAARREGGGARFEFTLPTREPEA